MPVAREKGSRGREASREIVNGFAQQAYADLAFPHKTVAVAQLQGALAAMRKHNNDDADDGRHRGRPWEEVGPFTLDVAREATQNNGLPTQWSGRLTAMAADPNCDSHRAGSTSAQRAAASGARTTRSDAARTGSRSTGGWTRPRSARF